MDEPMAATGSVVGRVGFNTLGVIVTRKSLVENVVHPCTSIAVTASTISWL